ncbi:hypothetical protein PIB30_058485 [Stylosanthes scabra]|uniref:Uncharacterized protein n=1 Tax=Stylosanthes scabra TaxID=79078 RepID=A0ABU6RJX9_9FABA|nr:hypothetical protein [Stylosanthes scabra]
MVVIIMQNSSIQLKLEQERKTLKGQVFIGGIRKSAGNYLPAPILPAEKIRRGDIFEAERCHGATLHDSKKQLPKSIKPDTTAKVHLVDLEPPGRKIPERPQSEGELDKVQIGPEAKQVTMIAKNLLDEVKTKLTHFLRRNIDLFAWTIADMLGVDPNFSNHKLSISPEASL